MIRCVFDNTKAIFQKPISIEIILSYELVYIDVYISYLGIICYFDFIMCNLFTFPPQMNMWSQNGTNQYVTVLFDNTTLGTTL